MSAIILRQFPDPVLERECAPVTDFDSRDFAELVKVLRGAVHDREQGAYGLSANQVGSALQVFVIRQWPGAFCNAELEPVERDGMELGEERCLSMPGLVVPVRRWKRVKVRYLDVTGRPRAYTLRGLDARAAQHLYDLTHGISIARAAEVDVAA